MAYLNDKTKFDDLAALLKEVQKKEDGQQNSNQITDKPGAPKPKAKNIPSSLSAISREYMIK